MHKYFGCFYFNKKKNKFEISKTFVTKKLSKK